MTNLVSPGTPTVLLHDAAARRRALLHAGGLLLIGAFTPVISAVLRLGVLYGVPWPPRTAHYVYVVRIGLAIVLFFWLSWAVIARTFLVDGVSPTKRLVLRGAAVGCGAASLYAAGPSNPFPVLGQVVSGCTVAWLAVEVCRSHGIVLERASRERDPQWRRAHTYDITVRAFVACLAGGGATFLSLQALRVLDVGFLPVMEQDQLTAVGVEGPLDLAGGVVFTVAVEDVVIVAAVAALMTAARRPVWQIYTTICLVEVLIHAYFGSPGLGMLLFAVLRLRLFLRYGRVLPLIVAHGAYDMVAGLIMPIALPYRLMAALPLAAVFVTLPYLVNRPSTDEGAAA